MTVPTDYNDIMPHQARTVNYSRRRRCAFDRKHKMKKSEAANECRLTDNLLFSDVLGDVEDDVDDEGHV